jgi:hypothetical protein
VVTEMHRGARGSFFFFFLVWSAEEDE